MIQNKSSKTVVILDNVFSEYEIEEKILANSGCFVTIHNPKSEQEIIDLTSTADGVIVNMHTLSKNIISRMKNCRIISRYGTGFDNVDLDAADQKRIWVSNVPDYCIEETSDHTIALLLSCTRKIALKDRLIRNGKWKLEQTIGSTRLAGKTLGILGFGKIGQAVYKKMSGWDLSRVLVYDPFQEDAMILEAGASPVSLEELCINSDIITLHVPLSEATSHLLDKKELSMMKKNAILINTSRGNIINEAALAEALLKYKIAGAGLDVFEKEPLSENSLFRQMDHVVLSDHTAYHSGESVIELKTLTALNVVETFKEGKPLYPVNRITDNDQQDKYALSSSSIY